MNEEVHLLDEGTVIKVAITENNLPLDLTDATVLKLKFKRKDQSTFMVDAQLFGLPTDGIIYCTSDETYFTLKGDMTVQAYVEYPSGKWHTSKGSFTVSENILAAE